MAITNNKEILLIFYVEYTESMLDILLHPKCTMVPPWLGPDKIFLYEGSQKAQNAIFRFVFANIMFHKRAMLQVFCTEYKESVLGILSYLESTMGPPWLGRRKSC